MTPWEDGNTYKRDSVHNVMQRALRWPAILAVVILVISACVVTYYSWPRSFRSNLRNSAPADVEGVLQHYLAKAQQQERNLAAYTSTETIHADLPGIKKQGTFVLRRHYQAPNTLEFKPVKFTGDRFVRNNVILGYLGRRAKHVQDGRGDESAITSENYTFQYRGKNEVNGSPAFVFDVHARESAPGLFDGRIYVSPKGDLLRAEGQLVESPSMFVKNAHFAEAYGHFGAFNLPVHMHSESDTELVGHAVMNIDNRDYQVQSKRGN